MILERFHTQSEARDAKATSSNNMITVDDEATPI